jgi:hypothetical protein
MSAARRKAEPRQSESAVYLDRDCIGSVLIVAKGEVHAIDVNGRRLGVYRSDKEAMAAVIAAARGRAA